MVIPLGCSLLKSLAHKDMEILNELNSEVVDYHISEFEAGNLDYIFGDKLRIAEKIDGGKKYKVPIKSILSDYDIDFDNWVAYKKSDKEKKQGVKINKALNKANKGDNPDSDKIEYLLKVHDLKSQTNALTESLYVIYSRAPIDIARMSDFQHMRSCHSADSDYFKCALADSNNAAAIAYLVTEGDFKTIKNLQAREIFQDHERELGGIEPLARIRIRVLTDGEGQQQAVPSLRVYGRKDYEKIFKEQLVEWAKEHANKDFNWNSELTHRGGSYEDMGVKIGDMVKLIFGRDIRYDYDSEDEDSVEYHSGISVEERDEIYEESVAQFLNSVNEHLDGHCHYVDHIASIECDHDLGSIEVEVNPSDYLKTNFDHTNHIISENANMSIYSDGTVDLSIRFRLDVADYFSAFVGDDGEVHIENHDVEGAADEILSEVSGYVTSYDVDSDEEHMKILFDLYEQAIHLPDWDQDMIIDFIISGDDRENLMGDKLTITAGDFSDYRGKMGDWIENYNNKFLDGDPNTNSTTVISHILKRIEEDGAIDYREVSKLMHEGMHEYFKSEDLDDIGYDGDSLISRQDIEDSLDISTDANRVTDSTVVKINFGLPSMDFTVEQGEGFTDMMMTLIEDGVDVAELAYAMRGSTKDYFKDLIVKYITDLNYDPRQMELDVASFKNFYKNYTLVF